MHKLIRYLLTPGAPERPDIFQAAYLAFQLKSKKSPIQNLHHLPLPIFSTLSITLGKPQPAPVESKSGSLNPQTPSKATPAPPHSPAHSNPPTQFGTPSAMTMETTTSVAPRSRPKGTSALKGPLPLPFQVNSLSGKKGAEPPKLDAPPVKAAQGAGVAASNPFPAPELSTQPSGPAFTNSNPFTSDVFQDPGPASLSAVTNNTSGPASLCSFPSEPEPGEVTVPTFSQGHRRHLSDTHR